MLNPLNSFHKLLAGMLFLFPSTRRRYLKCMQRYAPIAAQVFPDNPAATLLVVQALEQIEAGKIDAAQRTIEALRKATQQKDTPEAYALWHVLQALQQQKSNHLEKMAASLKAAANYGHHFHTAYAYHGEFYLKVRHDYAQAEEQFLKAIDCLYGLTRLTDPIQLLIGLLYTRVADCRTMMHRYPDAEDALRLARVSRVNPNDLILSKALYYAATRDGHAFKTYLRRFQAYHSQDLPGWEERLCLIYDKKHPHFTQQPLGSPEGIAAFWQHFLENENEIARLLRDGRRSDARALMAPPLQQMDTLEDDYWSFSPYLEGDACHLMFVSNFSRTYTPFVDALIAACPEEVRKRWVIVRKP